MHRFRLDLAHLAVETFATGAQDGPGAAQPLAAVALTASCGDTFCRDTCEFICPNRLQAAALLTGTCGPEFCGETGIVFCPVATA